MTTRNVIAVIVLNTENKFVILKRSSDKKVHANLWNLPSGGIESGESLEDAGIREVYEEIGLKIDIVKTGTSIIIKINDDFNLNINYLLAKAENTEVKLNPENSEFKWVSPSESLNYEFAVSRDEVERVLNEFKLLQNE